MSTAMVTCPHCGFDTNAACLRCKVCGERRAEMRADPEGSGTVRAEALPDSRTHEQRHDTGSSNVVRFESRGAARRGPRRPPFDGDPGPSAA